MESEIEFANPPAVTPIKFGIFDWIDRNRLALPELYEQRLRLVECADQNGFYCYHIA